ncbi:MAG TPA: acyl-ACP--UDP-N-acetylglucosamine O-acyltransferase [bacterium]|nr:acyl-ACP--UDP-N-acetylglucosamine O-acyltransferase [bacterium]
MPQIHPTAIVDPQARLGEGVVIGPYAVVDAHVTLGEGTQVGAHAVITGHTTLGKNNRIFTGAVLGSEPQDVKFRGETTYLEIGDNNLIREYATLNPGTGEGTKTVIGNDNWLMIQSHVGHNCVVGNHVKLANLATLGGHARVDDYANIGGVTPVHQFVHVGKFAMIGGGYRAVQDVAPFMIAGGEPLHIAGINQVGLERANFPKETIEQLKKAHKVIFRSHLTVKEAAEALSRDFPPLEEIKTLIDFITHSQRGIVR